MVSSHNEVNTKLQDIFAPREEVGFSLVSQLELDLEDEPIFDTQAVTDAPVDPPPSIAFTPRQTSFFPDAKSHLLDFPGKGKDFNFFCVDNDEEIERRWEESRVELTRGWKKRWREAGKTRRRLGIATADRKSVV